MGGKFLSRPTPNPPGANSVSYPTAQWGSTREIGTNQVYLVKGSASRSQAHLQARCSKRYNPAGRLAMHMYAKRKYGSHLNAERRASRPLLGW
ncbi:unnamed protein product [Vitrella brassicaformis CCMP3155]|uniref:Uncharacterized protein n=1 Tax=Vitrella brassicaformis (strain CCMP3155) TaxID=1169540 RepID=A0A0G4H626_VITBC|nr:unnamed protein product [Vitrella brassicaformis CCMP3155]|eukprot:CEM39042.1 unnamed protein product [Vitrella brassicaformis CCMP3155]